MSAIMFCFFGGGSLGTVKAIHFRPIYSYIRDTHDETFSVCALYVPFQLKFDLALC